MFVAYRKIRSEDRDPDPEDNSLARKEPSTCKRGSILHLQHCFLINDILLRLGSLCLLLKQEANKTGARSEAKPRKGVLAAFQLSSPVALTYIYIYI